MGSLEESTSILAPMNTHLRYFDGGGGGGGGGGREILISGDQGSVEIRDQ